MNPTRLDKSELFYVNEALKNRVNATLAFIDEIKGTCLDAGERNFMTESIENKFKISVDSTKGDLDRCPIGKCDTLFCFEVLEHLYNPLFFLENIKADIIYLSTPRQWAQSLKAVHHFHEIPTDRLMWLFDEAGLQILKEGKITIAGNWYNHLGGVRPFLRYFQKTRIYKLCLK